MRRKYACALASCLYACGQPLVEEAKTYTINALDHDYCVWHICMCTLKCNVCVRALKELL